MSAEKFSILAVTVYTLKSAHGVIELKGDKALREHGENLLGAFVDRLTGENTGNMFKDKQRNFDFIMKHRQELETIFAIQDAIKETLTPAPCCNCDNDH